MTASGDRESDDLFDDNFGELLGLGYDAEDRRMLGLPPQPQRRRLERARLAQLERARRICGATPLSFRQNAVAPGVQCVVREQGQISLLPPFRVCVSPGFRVLEIQIGNAVLSANCGPIAPAHFNVDATNGHHTPRGLQLIDAPPLLLGQLATFIVENIENAPRDFHATLWGFRDAVNLYELADEPWTLRELEDTKRKLEAAREELRRAKRRDTAAERAELERTHAERIQEMRREHTAELEALREALRQHNRMLREAMEAPPRSRAPEPEDDGGAWSTATDEYP